MGQFKCAGRGSDLGAEKPLGAVESARGWGSLGGGLLKANWGPSWQLLPTLLFTPSRPARWADPPAPGCAPGWSVHGSGAEALTHGTDPTEGARFGGVGGDRVRSILDTFLCALAGARLS